MIKIDCSYQNIDGTLFVVASSTDPEIDGIKATGNDTKDMWWNLKNYLELKLEEGVRLNYVKTKK